MKRRIRFNLQQKCEKSRSFVIKTSLARRKFFVKIECTNSQYSPIN